MRRNTGRTISPADVQVASERSLVASDIGKPSQDLLSGGAESDPSVASDPSEYESGELSEEEDELPKSVFSIGQLVEGWYGVERKAPGNSWSQVYKQWGCHHRNKDEKKGERVENMAREAGIPVSKIAKPIYGDIALLFDVKASPRLR